jgi:hypothetical protein
MDATGQEDQAIALNLSAALVDRDGSEALSVVIAGLPAGARLSAGINNGDGSWTLTPGQLASLTVTPPGNWSGGMALTMDAHAMERSTGAVATTRVGFNVAVGAVADAPLVDAPTTASGREDTAIRLDIVARLTDTDGSETLTLHVAGVPAGAAFSAGTMNPDGSWSIPGTSLAGLTFTPPLNYAGTLRLDFAATAREATGEISSLGFQVAVTVDPVADAPTLSLSALNGTEDTALTLPIAATLTDTDGSEAIDRYVIRGLPAGASLSAGSLNGDGSWTLTPAQADGVALVPPANYAGSFTLTVSAYSRERANGSEAHTTATLPVSLAAVADAPVLTANNVSGTEDQSVPLALAATLGDTDGSESFDAILVSGLPAGFALSAGTALPNGDWSLAPGDLAGLRLTAPPDWNGTLALSLQATAQDGDSTASASRDFAVTIAPVNDAPTLALSPGGGAFAGEARAAVVRDAAIADVDSARMGGATITLSGAGAGDRLVFAGFALNTSGGGTTIGDTGIAVSTAPDGTVTLTGNASIGTYESVLESLAVENTANGLAAGTRGIGITLRDEAGAPAATQVVALAVTPSHIVGGAADAVLNGTAGHDTFTGGGGNETMLGGAGADLFIVAMGAGNDSIVGGAGAWTDTIRVDGAGSPTGGNWTLVLDSGTTMTANDNSFDFAQPAAGQILFADGSQIEFQQIERIAW